MSGSTTVSECRPSTGAATSQATVSDASLASFLASLAAATQAQNTLSQTLPTHAIDTGGPTPAYLIDSTGAAAMINGAFADSKPSNTTRPVRVLVQNGVGTPGLGESAYQKLHRAGFSFLPGGNANHFGYSKTVVLIPDGSSHWIQEGQQVARTLGVPNSAVMINDHTAFRVDWMPFAGLRESGLGEDDVGIVVEEILVRVAREIFVVDPEP